MSTPAPEYPFSVFVHTADGSKWTMEEYMRKLGALNIDHISQVVGSAPGPTDQPAADEPIVTRQGGSSYHEPIFLEEIPATEEEIMRRIPLAAALLKSREVDRTIMGDDPTVVKRGE